jgi:glycosyl transferase family 2
MPLERAATRALGIEARRYPERSEQPIMAAAGALARMDSPHAAEHPDEIRGTGCPVGHPMERAPNGSVQEMLHRRADVTTLWETEPKTFITTAGVRFRLLRLPRGKEVFSRVVSYSDGTRRRPSRQPAFPHAPARWHLGQHPSHDGAAYIGGPIDSVLRQTTPPGEILVIDDCSSDRTVAIVSELAGRSSTPIRIIRLEQNRGGPAHPINVGSSRRPWT